MKTIYSLLAVTCLILASFSMTSAEPIENEVLGNVTHHSSGESLPDFYLAQIIRENQISPFSLGNSFINRKCQEYCRKSTTNRSFVGDCNKKLFPILCRFCRRIKCVSTSGPLL
ncbi:uncharacterized protein LOC143465488 [Clavelina lepadiformis]|uniref:uncharacterized protein LOC143465488 n=1 Tax=Clavelina lepadiformis TaxID=159417 RepID=UPI0040415AE9